MTKMPGEGDIDTQHNGGQVCGKKIISLGVEGFEPENNRCDNIVYTLCISAPGAAKRGRESERKQQERIHNLHTLFNDLSEDSKHQIEAEYKRLKDRKHPSDTKWTSAVSIVT